MNKPLKAIHSDNFQDSHHRRRLIEEVKRHIEQEDRPALTKVIGHIRPADMADPIEYKEFGW